jgi:trypsin-like peptidase
MSEQDSGGRVVGVDTLSLTALFIRMLVGAECLATGTAFLWRHEGKSFLVSNWHNFAGRHPALGEPQDNKPLSKSLGIPDRVEVVLGKRDAPAVGVLQKGETIPWDTFTFPLIGDAGEPLFWEHPLGSKVDIAALPVDLHPHVVPFHLNEIPFEPDITFRAGQDVFIIGYPLGQITGNPLPIWKRGSIASEPYAPIDGLNKVFVDTASRPGMSGSFVVARHAGNFTPPGKTTVFGTARKLLGIYSGRLAPSSIEAQLGIVWHREEIDRTLRQGQPAQIRE